MPKPAPQPLQINWLELARAAAGPGGDVQQGVRRLATLAAAVHRATDSAARVESTPHRSKAPQAILSHLRAQGRAPQVDQHPAPAGRWHRVTEDPR